MQANSNDVLGIDPDVRQLVYTQAVANGGAASYDIMQGLYLSVSPFTCLSCLPLCTCSVDATVRIVDVLTSSIGYSLQHV